MVKKKIVMLVLFGFSLALGVFAQQPVPVPPPVVIPPETVLAAQIQAMLSKGPEYFAIAERANKTLSAEEKARLAAAIGPLLARGEALLGGAKAPPTVMAKIPPELDDLLRAIVTEINTQVERTLGRERVMGLVLLRPVTEVMLAPPHTHWTCYWSYVYAYWTYIYAYWTYICYDTYLAYLTMVYAYYSYVYAYFCYLQC